MSRRLSDTKNPALFDDLVKAGDFSFVDFGFISGYQGREWIDKGDRVRGAFKILNMGRNYRETDLPAALARESKRTGRTLLLATAYELAYYASHGWIGDRLIGFGSSLHTPAGERLVSYLMSSGTYCKLGLSWADGEWGERDLVLCVIQ